MAIYIEFHKGGNETVGHDENGHIYLTSGSDYAQKVNKKYKDYSLAEFQKAFEKANEEKRFGYIRYAPHSCMVRDILHLERKIASSEEYAKTSKDLSEAQKKAILRNAKGKRLRLAELNTERIKIEKEMLDKYGFKC